MGYPFRLNPGWLPPLLVALAGGYQTLRPAFHGANNTTSYYAPPEVFITNTLAGTGARPRLPPAAALGP